MSSLEFVTCDVFTEHRFGGNPLAVVFEAHGLDAQAMQRIAREFNLSETTFVTPPESGDHTARVRIFTPALEMPFAGHPVIGTAIELARRQGLDGKQTLVLELNVGPVDVEVEIGGARARARFTAAGLPAEQPLAASRDALGDALGITSGDIGFDDHVPRVFDVGPIFTFVPLKSLRAANKAFVNGDAFDNAIGSTEAPFVFLYTRETEMEDADFHGRMFAPTGGVPEDPATGSAVTAFAGQLEGSGELAEGGQKWLIEQGIEMGRPSRLFLETDTTEGVLERIRVAGSAIRVSAGSIVVLD